MCEEKNNESELMPLLCVDCYPEHCLCEGKTCWCDPVIFKEGDSKIFVHREVH